MSLENVPLHQNLGARHPLVTSLIFCLISIMTLFMRSVLQIFLFSLFLGLLMDEMDVQNLAHSDVIYFCSPFSDLLL